MEGLQPEKGPSARGLIHHGLPVLSHQGHGVWYNRLELLKVLKFCPISNEKPDFSH